MNIQNITITNIDGTTTDWVQIEVAPNEFVGMTKEIYDAQQAAQNTLPSESSTPQAGA